MKLKFDENWRNQHTQVVGGERAVAIVAVDVGGERADAVAVSRERANLVGVFGVFHVVDGLLNWIGRFIVKCKKADMDARNFLNV